eukprot:245825-Prorocentrum_minimum.AAC.1
MPVDDAFQQNLLFENGSEISDESEISKFTDDNEDYDEGVFDDGGVSSRGGGAGEGGGAFDQKGWGPAGWNPNWDPADGAGFGEEEVWQENAATWEGSQ